MKYFHTANLLPGTISSATSFPVVYLTFRRSPFFAPAYASNDVVLILLRAPACAVGTRYLSVVICFVAFLANDVYGFVNR